MYIILYFNSIKVRLERLAAELRDDLTCIFQFHKGAIRTQQRDIAEMTIQQNFNSIKVRLELTI